MTIPFTTRSLFPLVEGNNDMAIPSCIINRISTITIRCCLCFSVYGWGRWTSIRDACDMKHDLSDVGIEHMCRTLLLHCLREFTGEEKVAEFVWRLILPRSESTPRSGRGSKTRTSIYHEAWAALPEFNPPALAVDTAFQRHLQRHANKVSNG